MSTDPTAYIKIRPAGFFRNWDIFQQVDYVNVTDDYIMRLLNMVRDQMRQNAPVRTGALRDSISIKMINKVGGGPDRRYNATVGPTVPYAMFPEAGAKESVGRFVAAIGVRIHKGEHPGQKAQWYVQRTYSTMQSKIPMSLAMDVSPKIRAAFEARMNR